MSDVGPYNNIKIIKSILHAKAELRECILFVCITTDIRRRVKKVDSEKEGQVLSKVQ
jgi:hypothetical protein